MLVVYRHLLGESHPAAGERPEGMLGGCGGRVEGARSESGAAREQAVIGEGVEGFSQVAHGESTALGIGQAKRPRAQVLPEDPILLPEIRDQIVLVAVHPASERENEEL